MERIKRKRIARRAKIQIISAWIIGIMGVIWLVLAFTVFIEPLRELLAAPEGEDINLLKFGIFMFTMFGSFFIALVLSMYGKIDQNRLGMYKRELYKKRLYHAVGLFWEAIKVQDWETAKRLYNGKGLIWGSERILCNGVIIGARQIANHTEWKESPDQRMKSYLTKESSQ